ncbi:hypothetical protein BG011_008519 [Mortierella polycephala]|uniref:Uncharacterized protein n=1 Tax=Mortierella polycephala TaxID=41804 RepID=A0A9P6PPK0_9FUNG|nr:hypothetical protein BG011_008519 [Mortierella polycephala]
MEHPGFYSYAGYAKQPADHSPTTSPKSTLTTAIRSDIAVSASSPQSPTIELSSQTTSTPHSDNPFAPGFHDNSHIPANQPFQKLQPDSTPPTIRSEENVYFMSPFVQRSNGPSIIDLSSGEELIALHLGENEHKRRRDSDCDSESEPSIPSIPLDPLQEVFEIRDDGTLLPILDYSLTQPSPAKKMRLGKSHHDHLHLQFLSEEESDVDVPGSKTTLREDRDRKCSNRSHGSVRSFQYGHWAESARRKRDMFGLGGTHTVSSRFRDDVNFESDRLGDAQDGVTQAHDGDQKMDEQSSQVGENTMDSSPSEKAVPDAAKGTQALFQYQGPRTLSIPDGVDMLDWGHWGDSELDHTFALNDLQVHEIVLYRLGTAGSGQVEDQSSHVVSQVDCIQQDEGNHPELGVTIEELEDDNDDGDGNIADDEGCELLDYDAPLVELGEKIMDMDLD